MPCIGDNKLIYSISELPTVASLAPGDKFVIGALDGTYLVDYENFIFDLNQTTFAGVFAKHTTDIAILSSKTSTEAILFYEDIFNDLSSNSLSALESAMADLQIYVDTLYSRYMELEGRR